MSAITASIGTSLNPDTREAVHDALERARAGLAGKAPAVAVVTTTVDHPAKTSFAAFREGLGSNVAIHGATTSLGVLGHGGVIAGPDGSVGVMLLAADEGAHLFTASGAIGANARDSGRDAARQLSVRAKGLGDPRAILLHASPGKEEELLVGIAEVFPQAPVFGGSAADHAIAGEWSVFTEEGPQGNALSMVGFFGDLRAGGALVAPFEPSGSEGRVTAADDRVLASVDGRPAADVLGEWVGGAIDFQVREGGNVLAQTALRPLGKRRRGSDGDHFVTIHPAQIKRPAGTVDLFARTETGETLCAMRGTREGLIEAIPRVVADALATTGLKKDEVRAAILIYCAGCAGSVGALLDEGLKRHLGAQLPGTPLLGFCTFGEQGHVPGLGNVHQDLSLSLLLVG